MSWLERLSVEADSKPAIRDEHRETDDRMSPGLTGQYDAELREKAGLHIPPPPPEHMGVEGEYDPCGLAKRIAIALDHDPEMEDLNTVKIVQKGSTICFTGQVPDQETLEHLKEVACHADGTKAVDMSQVKVG